MNVSLPPLPAGLVVQVLLMICSTACSAQNATVAFTVLALVTMLPVFVALFAKQLFVETWNLHQVSLVPLRQGSVLVVFSFCRMFPPIHYGALKCFHHPSKKDEIKTMGDVKSQLQKVHSKVHQKRKFLGQLYDEDPSETVSPVKT